MKYFISDTCTLCGRILKHSLRSVDTIITVVIMPVMIMLLFVFVLGGAMQTDGASYVNFILPGVLLYCAASGVSYSAIRVNNDMTGGIFERFHSMPIARPAILSAHVVASMVLDIVSLAAVLGISFAVGFRPQAGVSGWVLAMGILLLCVLGMTWIAMTFGLLAKSAEGASVFSYILMMLIFISSAFAPTDTMPKAVQAFAAHQPLTPIIESIRSLLAGQPAGSETLLALVWCVIMIAGFTAAALFVYRRRVK